MQLMGKYISRKIAEVMMTGNILDFIRTILKPRIFINSGCIVLYAFESFGFSMVNGNVALI